MVTPVHPKYTLFWLPQGIFTTTTMAPPVVVHSRAEVQLQFAEQLKNPEKYKCQLKSLTQNECTYKILEEGYEFVCLPFKRVFQRCLVPETKTINGKKHHGERWINIEVTDAQTNNIRRVKYGPDIEKFLQVEKETYKWLEEHGVPDSIPERAKE